MPSQQHADRLAKAIESTGLAQAVRTTFADSRINVLCRVPEKFEKKWIDTIRNILSEEQKSKQFAHAWNAHICRHYFLRSDSVVWGWNISIQSRDMQNSLDFIIQALKGEQTQTSQGGTIIADIVEVDLVGRLPSTHANGKGVTPVGGYADFHPARGMNR